MYKKFIDQYISFNIIEWRVFKSKLKISQHKKGEIIHYAGDVCTSLMFINFGIARAYIIDDENAKITNLYLVDYDSFIHQNVSDISIEILEDCELLMLSYDDVQFLYNKLKKGEQFGRLMAESAYFYTHNYIIERISKNATQRFKKFMKNTPYLLEKVPQYHIATLLGIAPQSLSRLKKCLT